MDIKDAEERVELNTKLTIFCNLHRPEAIDHKHQITDF